MKEYNKLDQKHVSKVDVGRVPEGAVYESNMSIESCIESNRVGLPITPIPDWFWKVRQYLNSCLAFCLRMKLENWNNAT